MILLERMKAGFHKNQSCVDEIASQQNTVEQSEEWNSPFWSFSLTMKRPLTVWTEQSLRNLRENGQPCNVII